MPDFITHEQWSMIQYWRSVTPNISAESLVGNLTRRFKMQKATAWILITRLRNEEHTRVHG